MKTARDSLSIQLDHQRRLAHGDPTGRETYISLGIFTEACVIALARHGYSAAKPVLKGEDINLKVTSSAPQDNNDDIQALTDRFTDRTVFKKADLTPESASKLEASWHSKEVEVICTDKPGLIQKTAELTRQALLLAFSNPDFRRELTDYFVDTPDIPFGIPLSTLGVSKAKTRFIKKLINSGLNRKQEAAAEYRRWRSASGLVFILANGDSKTYWLESGRAYLRASLEIQKLGLSQATSAAVVEAADFHEDIEKLLGTSKRIQCVIRIGRGSRKRRPSGRLAPEEILIT